MTSSLFRPTALRPIHALFLAVLCLAFYLPGFAALPPFDRDESRYAQATRQMLETGDFIDIRFQDEARHKKPVGIYWLQSASAALIGGGSDGPIWNYRIPSLVGAIAAVLMTCWIGARLFGPMAGLAAGVILAATVILGVEARMAKTDAVLLATIVAVQGALAHAYLNRGAPQPLGVPSVLVFWIAMGLGVLVKGPIAPMVTGGTIGLLAILDRNVGWLRRLRPMIGVPVLLAVVLPWLIAIGLATDGAFFTYAIGHEFLGKANTGQEEHGAPPGYHLLVFWLMFWPFSLAAALALPWIWRHRADAAVRFCIAWILPTWVIFELVLTKLPHYTLPVLPALALLTSAALLDRHRAGGTSRGIWFWIAMLLFVAVSLALAGAVAALPWKMENRLEPVALLGGLAVLAAAAGAIHMEWRRGLGRSAAVIPAGALLTYLMVHGAVLPGLEPVWLSRHVQERLIQTRPCPDSTLAAAGYTEPSLVFLTETGTRLGSGDMVASHLLQDPACAVGLIADGEEARFQGALTTAGAPEPRLLADIAGFNYSRGQWTRLRLYTLAPAAP